MSHKKHPQSHSHNHDHAQEQVHELKRLHSHKTPAEHAEHQGSKHHHKVYQNEAKSRKSKHRIMTHVVAPVASLLLVAGVTFGAQIITDKPATKSGVPNTVNNEVQLAPDQAATPQAESEVARSAPAVPKNSVCRTFGQSGPTLSAEDHRIGMVLDNPRLPNVVTFNTGTYSRNYLYAIDGNNTEYSLGSISSNVLRSKGVSFLYIKACIVNPGPAIAPFTSRWTMVDQQYVDFYGRHATAGEQAMWANSGSSAAQIVDWFVNGETKQRGQLVRLYKAYYKRWPDASGYAFWVAKLKAGGDINDVSDFFSRSAEFKSTYGSLDNAQFVQLVYNNVMGRTPDAGGYTYWVNQLNTGKTTRGRMMLQFSESKEYRSKFGPDCDLVGVTLRMLRRAPTATELQNWNPDLTAHDLAYPILFQSSEYARRIKK